MTYVCLDCPEEFSEEDMETGKVDEHLDKEEHAGVVRK